MEAKEEKVLAVSSKIYLFMAICAGLDGDRPDTKGKGALVSFEQLI